jgi:hypothetical protein
MTQRQPKCPREEVAERGRAIYKQQLRPKLWPQFKGKILVIDVDTGEYEVDDNSLVATQRLLERCPGAQIWAERIGYIAVRSFGGRPIPEDEG